MCKVNIALLINGGLLIVNEAFALSTRCRVTINYYAIVSTGWKHSCRAVRNQLKPVYTLILCTVLSASALRPTPGWCRMRCVGLDAHELNVDTLTANYRRP